MLAGGEVVLDRPLGGGPAAAPLRPARAGEQVAGLVHGASNRSCSSVRAAVCRWSAIRFTVSPESLRRSYSSSRSSRLLANYQSAMPHCAGSVRRHHVAALGAGGDEHSRPDCSWPPVCDAISGTHAAPIRARAPPVGLLPSPVRRLPTAEVGYDYDRVLFVDRVEQPVVAQSIPIEVAELALQPLDVGPEVRLAAKQRIHDVPNARIETGKGLVLAQCPAERLGLRDGVTTRRSGTLYHSLRTAHAAESTPSRRPRVSQPSPDRKPQPLP